MYHVTLTKEGKTICDLDTDCACVLAHCEGGFLANVVGGGKFETAYDLILSLDGMLNKLLSDHPALKIAYALKDELSETTSVDLSTLMNALDKEEE